MALGARAWQTREFNRARMPGVALRTAPNRSIIIGLADGVTLLATGCSGGMSLRNHQRIRRTLRPAWLELFAEGNLLRTESLFAVDGCPAWSRVPAAQKFLIDAFVTGAAIAGRQMGADHETVMIDFLLARSGLVTVKAVDALFRVGRHLILVNN